MNTSQEQIIFSGLLKPLSDSRELRSEFLSRFSDGSIFKNEYFVLHSLIKSFPTTVFTVEFIKLYLQNNKAEYLKSNNVDLDEFSMGDTDSYLTFMESCINIAETCIASVVTKEQFDLAIEAFRMEYINEASISLLEQGATIMGEGLQVGHNRSLNGFSDMSSYVINGINKLINLVNRKNRKGIIVYGDDIAPEEDEPCSIVCPYGIDGLDKALGGIYEGDMVSILAPPKGGKSRISAFMVHNAIINGASVATWSIENGLKGIEALIRACHFNWFYNRNKTDSSQILRIDSNDIRRGTLDGELRAMEQISWQDLMTNPNYGRWANIDEDFDADTFLTVLDNAVSLVNAKLILIDYLQLITGDGKLSKNERIGQCYQRALQFLTQKKIAGIFPAQFKQTALGDLSKLTKSELADVDLRDAGGETSEVIRTPSVLMALYADKQSLRMNEATLLSLPSRNAKSFEPIDLAVQFECCTFTDMSTAQEG